jgi:hypothetical protein
MEIHNRELATPFDEETQARLATGALMAGPSGADTFRAERPRTGLPPDRE